MCVCVNAYVHTCVRGCLCVCLMVGLKVILLSAKHQSSTNDASIGDASRQADKELDAELPRSAPKYVTLEFEKADVSWLSSTFLYSFTWHVE